MAISFENLQFTYFEDRKPVLAQVSAAFDASEITVLTGPSGCGKSTLLYLAAGIYPQAAGLVQGGRVTVEGVEPASLKPPERCRLVGLMFQNPELQFCMDTVEHELVFCMENIALPRVLLDKAKDELTVSIREVEQA